MRQLSKSPFLYLGLATLLIGSLAGFLLDKNKSNFSLAKDVLDDSQYLIFATGKPSEQIVFAMVDGTTLQPSAPPALAQGRTLASLEEVDYGLSQARKEIELYIVQKDETVSLVAQKFGISNETVLWANDLTNKSILRVGQELVILPVSGTMHIVKSGETLNGIAKLYQAKAKDIVDFNELADDSNIKTGDFLVIPGGLKLKVVPKYNPVPLPNSYFICPIPSPCVISQGLHWFNAVDFSNNRCGDPVFAAVGGEVQRVSFTQVGGNFVQVLHSNGVVTYYGHLSGTVVGVGQKVDQGQVLGYVGHTGQTVPAGEAGCHLHFDVRFGVNSFSKYPVGAKLGR
ncbi:hypothetical protein COT20_02500 [bacterium (Candidatus Gribaldobacteria) CG08_land_8_20_14_0_20_39_15]|uniref:LysM domain-containing protein n=1 Tax=bacterium (Candidatus Gribaldobacteria) CG08_land_8_20_14_0_20_39_15 TaxID=2014273 RepID=A0A2M6XTZ6_9BACT|nr:MAG: hypothetical protein COT20_02500 [bacterium (Candidatus Gribaldobacteria) CG08_land_8_20_14_0_20_39_15]